MGAPSWGNVCLSGASLCRPGPGVGAELYKGQCNLATGKKLRYVSVRHAFSSDNVQDLSGAQ